MHEMRLCPRITSYYHKREFEISKTPKKMISKTQGILTSPNFPRALKQGWKSLDVTASRTQLPDPTMYLRSGFLVEASKSSENFGPLSRKSHSQEQEQEHKFYLFSPLALDCGGNHRTRALVERRVEPVQPYAMVLKTLSPTTFGHQLHQGCGIQ